MFMLKLATSIIIASNAIGVEDTVGDRVTLTVESGNGRKTKTSFDSMNVCLHYKDWFLDRPYVVSAKCTPETDSLDPND